MTSGTFYRLRILGLQNLVDSDNATYGITEGCLTQQSIDPLLSKMNEAIQAARSGPELSLLLYIYTCIVILKEQGVVHSSLFIQPSISLRLLFPSFKKKLKWARVTERFKKMLSTQLLKSSSSMPLARATSRSYGGCSYLKASGLKTGQVQRERPWQKLLGLSRKHLRIPCQALHLMQIRNIQRQVTSMNRPQTLFFLTILEKLALSLQRSFHMYSNRHMSTFCYGCVEETKRARESRGRDGRTDGRIDMYTIHGM